MAMRLRGLREDLEMSIEEVASKCNVAIDDLQKYESGEHDIPMNFLCNAAEVLGVEKVYFNNFVSGEVNFDRASKVALVRVIREVKPDIIIFIFIDSLCNRLSVSQKSDINRLVSQMKSIIEHVIDFSAIY